MKKHSYLLLAVGLALFSACNNSGTNEKSGMDSTSTTTTTTKSSFKGRMIPNFETRKFMDLKTNEPITLRWDTTNNYYISSTGNEPGYYYDPESHDTFDYRGRVLNNALSYTNGDYALDESRIPADEMISTDTIGMSSSDGDTSKSTSSESGKMKIKFKDDKYKEKTDTSKLKVTSNTMKVKSK